MQYFIFFPGVWVGLFIHAFLFMVQLICTFKCREMHHPTTATGTQLLLYKLQFGLAAMATFAAPLFRAVARRRWWCTERWWWWWRLLIVLDLTYSCSLLRWSIIFWLWGWRQANILLNRTKRLQSRSTVIFNELPENSKLLKGLTEQLYSISAGVKPVYMMSENTFVPPIKH